MSVITQDGDSALMIAIRKLGRTEFVPLLLKAGANTDLQNKVCQHIMTYIFTIPFRYIVVLKRNAECLLIL